MKRVFFITTLLGINAFIFYELWQSLNAYVYREEVVSTPVALLTPIKHVIEASGFPGSKVLLQDIIISFDKRSSMPEAGKEMILQWHMLNAHTEEPITSFEELHANQTHFYFVRQDFLGGVVHGHATFSKKEKAWVNRVTFPLGGLWNGVIEFARRGIYYRYYTAVHVKGGEKGEEVSKNRDRSINEWHTIFSTRPEIVHAGQQVDLGFSINGLHSKKDFTNLHIAKNANLLLVRKGDTFIWNIHGDGTTDAISSKVGINVERIGESEYPYYVRITFPKPGTWLVRLEGFGTQDFLVDVLP